MRSIAIVNQKGGCGKSTTAINLAAFLARAGRRTLVVDMDPQGHATLGLLTHAGPVSPTMYDVLVHHGNGRTTSLSDITRAVSANLALAPADILLSAAPEKLGVLPDREHILARVLDSVRPDFDYVLVDCPPQVGFLTFNALCACSEAIVPVDPSFFSLHGLGKLMETFDVLATRTGHHVGVRALVTLFTGRTPFARAIVDEIRTHFAERHFATIIRYSPKLAEAASHGRPIADYCRDCVGFDDYKALAGEVLDLERIETNDAHPCAPTVTADGVLFAVEAPGARRVQLVGDFNAWRLDASEMTQVGRVWTRVLKLEPGRFQYRYVIDGAWCSDPLNTDVEPSPYGGHNSVVVFSGNALS